MKYKEELTSFDRDQNFRDIGGYRTGDGRVVCSGKLYRCSILPDMIQSEQEFIANLDVQVACDLRTSSERRKRSSVWLNRPNVICLVCDQESSSADLMRTFLTVPDSTAAQAHQHMSDIYRQLLVEQIDSYRELFHCIAEGKLPLVFFCTYGKDRTGIAASLILSAVGVSREHVIEDYLKSSTFFERGCAIMLEDSGSREYLERISEIWFPLIRVEREYIEAMFDQVDRGYGSVIGYLKKALGVDIKMINRIRENLLI